MKPKNAVTVSIIATVLSALRTTETTGGAAQSKGFRTGRRNRDPTDDLEQHRVSEGRRTPAISAARSSVVRLPARALPSSRHIRECRAAAECPPAGRPSNAACRQAFRPASGLRRKPVAPGTQGTEGPIGGPRNNSFGRDATAMRLPPSAIKAGAWRYRGDDGGRAGCGQIRQRRSTRSYRPWPARSKGPGRRRARQTGR
jgi:hypothetical protein